MKRNYATLIFSVVILIPMNVAGVEVTIAQGTAVAARVCEAKLLDASREWWKAGGFDPKDIQTCSRILYFPERKHACFAAEFEIASTDRSGELFRHSLWLWFDQFGALVKNAEPVVLESTIIPGSPLMFH